MLTENFAGNNVRHFNSSSCELQIVPPEIVRVVIGLTGVLFPDTQTSAKFGVCQAALSTQASLADTHSNT